MDGPEPETEALAPLRGSMANWLALPRLEAIMSDPYKTQRAIVKLTIRISQM